MKKLRFISFICVLALVLTSASGIAYAVETEEVVVSPRVAETYFVVVNTSIYSSKSTSNPITPISKGTKLSGSSDNTAWTYSSAQWQKVTYGSYTGYVRCDKVVPYGKCYKVNQTSTYIYNTASDDSGYKYNFPFPVNTYVCVNSTSVPFYYVRAYYNGDIYTGYMQISHLTKCS